MAAAPIGDVPISRPRSTFTLDNHFLDLGDRLTWIEALRTGSGAVKNGVAAVETERVLKIVESLFRRLIATICQPTPRLKQHGGPQKTIAISPMTRTPRGAAETEDAFVGAVDPAAFLR